MSRILVADDNSNVQRTVTLALAGLGVEVVAVNNGEAAVRKLPDFMPDLVLADIFMPVRNGYEVCEFVKGDSRFAHVPVVLLAGAFDPFDEREAQRVGADGILKKPFVPPDPLITMVKTLLDRVAAERLVTVSVSKSVAAERSEPRAPVSSVPDFQVRETSEEPVDMPLTPRDMPVAFGEGERPIAFGSLFDTNSSNSTDSNTGVLEPLDDEQVLTSSRDVTLGEPAFWKNDTEVDDSTEPASDQSAEPADPSPVSEIPEEISLAEDSAINPTADPMELVREDRIETQNTVRSEIASDESLVLDPAQYARLTVDDSKAPELAANPIEWMATAPKEISVSAPEIIPVEPNHSDVAVATPENVCPDSNSRNLLHRDPDETLDISSAIHFDLPHGNTSPDDTARSTPKEAWADLIATNKLPAEAAVPEAFPIPEVVEPSIPTVDPDDTAKSIPKSKWADLDQAVQSSALEITRQTLQPVESTSGTTAKADAAPNSTPNSSLNSSPTSSLEQHVDPDPALVDAVVQRVLDKMRPQVVDIITKEFLRPVVQALVQREIEKK